jgi:hypothetical protein
MGKPWENVKWEFLNRNQLRKSEAKGKQESQHFFALRARK